jgi:hypothetical protein
MGPQTMPALGEPEPRSNQWRGQWGKRLSRDNRLCRADRAPAFLSLGLVLYGSIAVESLLLCLNFISLLFSVSLPNEPKLAV